MRRLHEFLSPFGRQILKELVMTPDGFYMSNPRDGIVEIYHHTLGTFMPKGRFRLEHRGMDHRDYGTAVAVRRTNWDGAISRRVLPLFDQLYLRRQFAIWARRPVDQEAVKAALQPKAQMGPPPAAQRAYSQHIAQQAQKMAQMVDSAVLEDLQKQLLGDTLNYMGRLVNPSLVARDDRLDSIRYNTFKVKPLPPGDFLKADGT